MSRPIENTSNFPRGSSPYFTEPSSTYLESSPSPTGLESSPGLIDRVNKWLRTPQRNPGTATAYPAFGLYMPFELKQGGILKALQGTQMPTQTSATPTLDAIMNNPLYMELFLQGLSNMLGKPVTADLVAAMAADANVGPLLELLALQMLKQSAKHGAKLNYINRLRGKCPEGLELVYFAKGGRICSACMGKKLENGGEPAYITKFKKSKSKIK